VDSDEDDDEGEGETAEQVVQHLKFEKNTRVTSLRVLLRDSLKERWCTSRFPRFAQSTHHIA
jgi:hypothetical protein